jgi:hypothetical protein
MRSIAKIAEAGPDSQGCLSKTAAATYLDDIATEL